MFTAKDVMSLRQRTGAGMMEAKKALEESKGDMDKAAEALRVKGMAKADKRSGKQTSEGVITSYVHHNGKVGALVEIAGASGEAAQQLARTIAEHVTAGVPVVPVSVTRDDVPSELVERERRIFTEQAAASGKPANIIQKMVDGRIDKFFKEITLLDQPWVRDDSKTIRDLVKGLGANVSIRRFARFQMGQE